MHWTRHRCTMMGRKHTDLRNLIERSIGFINGRYWRWKSTLMSGYSMTNMVMLVQTGKRTVNHHQLVVRKKSASSKSRSEGWEYRAAISLTRNITMHGEQEKHRARTYLLSMARVFRNYKTGSIFFQALQQLPCPWRIPSVAFGSCLLRSTDSTVQPTLMNGIPLEYLSLFEMTDLHQSHLFNDML